MQRFLRRELQRDVLEYANGSELPLRGGQIAS
jgi:hypothetical protein